MRKRLFTLLLCLALPLSACGQKSVETPEPTPTAEETATPSPSPAATPEPEPTPEDITELWGFPIDDTHDAFEVPTGGKLGTVLVTVEMKDEKPVSTVSVWNASDLEAPIQTMETEGVTTHRHELMDANFDGYMDFVYTWFSGAKNNDSGLYAWDEEQGQFVPKKDFIGDLVIDGEKNSIYIYANGAGPSGAAKIFRWEKEELILKRIIGFLYPETLEDGSIQQEIAVEDVVDGELREVARETYHTPDEIAAAMDAYYDGALLWYDLDYHGEEGNTLWGFPIDDAHDAFEVPTGGRLGTVLVTVESRRKENEKPDDEWDWLFDLEMLIRVWDPENFERPIQTMVKPMGGNVFGTHDVVDANFDGYLDFGCQYFAGNQPTYWYYWIWDETKGLFTEEPAFSVDETGEAVGGICMPTFDPETETVSGYARYGMAGAVGVSTFHRWENGRLACVRRVTTDMAEGSSDTVVLIIEDRTDGQLTEVFRKEYPLSGGEAYRESEKWYDLNYHGE